MPENQRSSIVPTLIVGRDPSIHLFQAPRLVAWHPGMTAPVAISVEDALALAEHLAGAELAPERIETFTAQGILTAEPVPDPAYPRPSPLRELVAAGAIPDHADGSHELPWNFALRPSPGGFVVWSVVAQTYVKLPLAATRVLLGFLGGRRPAEAGEAPEDSRIVAALLDHGLLLASERALNANIATTPVYDVATQLMSDILEIQHDLEALPTLDLSASAGERRKIPVYSLYYTHLLDVRSQLPLALGMIRAYAAAYKNGALLERFEFVPEYCFSPTAVRKAVARHGPGIVLCSDYLWSLDGNLAICDALKQLSPEFITIHGGPSVPARAEAGERFFADHGCVDVAVRGEGEQTVIAALEALAASERWPPSLERLAEVAGLTYRSGSGCVRTPDRPRADDIREFPSPYLAGAFDETMTEGILAAVLETNRGCPYKCTFCDWGSATNQKIKQFELDRVRDEITWIAKHEIPIIWCADANFGIFDRDVEIAQIVADAAREYGYPRQFVVNYAKNATKRLAQIIGILHEAGISANGIISIQTTDVRTLDIIRRSNIKTKRYNELLDIFRELALPLSTDLMLGLPGSTIDSLQRDLQYYFDREVPAKAYRTQVLPNSAMADPEYVERYAIEVDEERYITSTFSFTAEEYLHIQQLYAMYELCESKGILYYVLRHLQWDHGIEALEFLRGLAELVRERPADYPAITYVAQFGKWRFNVGGWRPFYDELVRYLERERGLALDSALATAIAVQEAVLMDAGRRFPLELELAHDFVAYCQARRAGSETPLRAYPPSRFTVTDPNDLCGLDPIRISQYDSHFETWQLESPLVTAQPVAFFVDKTHSRQSVASPAH